MTPEPPHNTIVDVSLAGIGVSLGAVTVDGFWQQQRAPFGGWRPEPAPRMKRQWQPRPLPATTWQEKS